MLLEEMIRLGKTDIQLSYNTNISKLKYRDKDLMKLWSQFQHKVQIYASLDDFGSKAEYIRHGTKWNEVMKNYEKLHKDSTVQLNITSSISLFNWPTLTTFIDYLQEQELAPWARVNGGAWQINPIYGPEEFSFQALPIEYKKQVIAEQKEYIQKLRVLDKNRNVAHQVELLMNQLEQLATLALAKDSWEEKKNRFRTEVRKIDGRRGEDFATTFPELARLIHEE